MRVLWVCNIMLPAVAKELGMSYSVREGWLSGILGRLLSRQDPDPGPGEEALTLGICFPVSDRTKLPGSPAPAGEPAQGCPAEKREADRREGSPASAGGPASLQWKLRLGPFGREVACYGFAEDLEHPERYDVALEPRFGQILSDFQPDLVHIFGTEFPHACACAKVWNRPGKTLVGIQGLCCACAREYMADLPREVAESRTLRDVLKKDSLKQQQQKFELRAAAEEKLLRLTGHVTGRTLFDKAITSQINPSCTYHFMNETMRDSFYEGSWDPEKCHRYEIFVSQADYPLKGFHYLLQAMKEILHDAPQAHICVAGNSVMGVDGIASRLKIPAYGKYLRRLEKEYGLQGKIRVLGRLDEEGMKRAYLSSHVFVCPSAVENSPNSVAEAQLLGVPVVASRAGGIPSVAEDKVGGLLFEKGNAHELARAVLKLFSSDREARALSASEREMAAAKYDGESNYRRLMEIYAAILGETGAVFP